MTRVRDLTTGMTRALTVALAVALAGCATSADLELGVTTQGLIECNPATIGQACDTDDDDCTIEECRKVRGGGARCVLTAAADDGTVCQSDGDVCTIDTCRAHTCDHAAAPWCGTDAGVPEEQGGGGSGTVSHPGGTPTVPGADAGVAFAGDIGGGGLGCASSAPGSGLAVPLLLLGLLLGRRRQPGRAAAAALVMVSVGAAAAPAQAQVDATVYRPASPGATSFVTEDATTLPSAAWDLGLTFELARDVLVVRDPDTGEAVAGGLLVGGRSTLHLGASVGLPAGLEVGAALPLIVDQSGDLTLVGGGALPARAAGDLALRVKMRVVGRPRWQLAAAVGGEVPLGASDTFSHDPSPVVAARLLAGATLGPVTLAAAAGRRWRERAMLGNLVVDDEWVAEAGVRVPVIDRRLWLVADGYVAIAVDQPAERQIPAEVLAGPRLRVAGPWLAQAGVGVGLTHGYGTPSLRGLVTLVWSPDRTPTPRLRDLVAVAAPRRAVEAPAPADHDRLVDRELACHATPDEPSCARPDPTPPELIIQRIVLEDRVLFDTARARVKRHGQRLLAGVVTTWTEHPEWDRIVVEGHTDERGGDAYNDWLGEERARRTRAALVKLGAPDARIDVVGYGGARPRATGTSEEARQQNRRVELVVLRRARLEPAERVSLP